MVKSMDEIEAGMKKLEQKIQDMQEKGDSLSEEIRDHDTELLARMANTAVPVVRIVGLNMLRRVSRIQRERSMIPFITRKR